MLAGAEPDVATGAFGLDQATLLTKALSAPSTKAATPAITIARSIPGRREDCCGLTSVDIFPLYFGYLWIANAISNAIDGH